MKHKRPKPPRESVLHDSELIPITDPAAQAALEEVFRKAKPAIPEILSEYSKTQSHHKQQGSDAKGQA